MRWHLVATATAVLTALYGGSLSCASCSSSPSLASDAGLEAGDDVGDVSVSDADAGCATAVIRQCDGSWCFVPPGCFTMGSPEGEWGRGLYDEDQVRVTLTHGFIIQEHETTQQDWRSTGLPDPSVSGADGGVGGRSNCIAPDCPVGNIDWYEALQFANAFSQTHALPACYVLSGCGGSMGQGTTCNSVSIAAPSVYDCPGFRLPTEAEWEYSARAGTQSAFYSGDIVQLKDVTDCAFDPNADSIAWYCSNASSATHPVGRRAPNALGLYDMSGNVGEWVNDRYTGLGYGAGALVDPGAQIEFVDAAVLRGGWAFGWTSELRSANRIAGIRYSHGPGTGMRLVRTVRVGPDSGVTTDAAGN